MADGAAFKAKITALLTNLQASPRTVYLRTVTVVGGDPLLGIGGDVTNVDTLVDPPPAVEMIASEEIALSGRLLQPGDWRFTFDATVTEEDLRGSQLVYGDEVLHIVRVEPYAFGGVIVAYSAIARTLAART